MHKTTTYNSTKGHKLKTFTLIILLAASLIGAGAYGFFVTSNEPSSLSSVSTNSDYTNAQNKVNTLSQQLKTNPQDIALQQDLGNAYYDLGAAAVKNDPEKAKEAYKQAVSNYQIVLENKQDLNVLTDMATVAYYSGQYDLAEKSYQKALSINPAFAPALNNYGIFLYEIKKDKTSAIRLWQTALNQDPSGPNADVLKKMINQAKGE